MNKICTTIEQSKKLLELGIDINTADMYWWTHRKMYYRAAMDDGDFNKELDIPAWSLTALLRLMPGVNLYNSGNKTKIENAYKTIRNDISLIDAAFEMICWLKENGKI